MKTANLTQRTKIIILIITIGSIIYWAFYSFLLFGFFAIIFDSSFFSSDNYAEAKKESTEFLNENINALETISNKMLYNKSDERKKFKGVEYTYINSDSKEYIEFDIDAQGFLGGQYWGLRYSPNDDLINNKNIEIYNENDTGKGNNIFIQEKIKKHWYFYYIDYDGMVDLDKIQK